MVNFILMRNRKFFCRKCKRVFETPRFYEEKHGLDHPPYERIGVCWVCGSDDFLEFDTVIDKFEISERLLTAISALNRYCNALKDIYGNDFQNEDLSTGTEVLIELMGEVFDYMDCDMQNKLFKIVTQKDVEKFLLYLRG